MSKKDNGLFNFPSNSRAKQERVSFKKGGKVESKREWKTNPKPKSMKAKTKPQTFKGKEMKPVALPKAKKYKEKKKYFFGGKTFGLKRPIDKDES